MENIDHQRRLALATTAAAALGGAAAVSGAATLGGGAAPGETVNPSSAARTPRMQAYQIGAQQGIGSLARVDRAAPTPSAGEVVVDMRAAALNHRDLDILAGRYGGRKPAERIPVGDGAGVVVEVGPGVTGVQRGERVTAAHFTLWTDGDYDPSIFAADAGNTRDGWLAERIVLPANSLVRIPENLSFEAAAALGAAGITAWAVLETLGRIKAGDTVLTLGTGGVAVLALQIAKMCGARVAITSSSDEKLALCRKLGADITVNYRNQPAWHEAVRAANGGRGVDIVVETVGASTLSQSLAACAPNARVGLLGALGGPAPAPPNLGPLILNNVVLKGITSGSRRNLEDLLRASAANRLAPHIDRSFAFDEAAQALAYLASGEHVGKIVIRRG
jgi:NADPH:quinone reductase-like Zn-dependent oxidoreductase